MMIVREESFNRRNELEKEKSFSYEKIGKYQRLGIIDSSLDIGSLRKAAGEGFKFGPDGLIGKAAEKSGLKQLNKKTTQL